MSARAIGSATISFGLVSIPTKLYSAGNPSSGVHFNLVHRKCGTRLKQQYVCPKDGEQVPRDEMAKGYEFSKGQYVLFSDEELKKLQERPTHSIDITEFVPLQKIDPIYFDKSYSSDNKGADRAYRLLAQALKKSGRAALAKYAARGKQYLVMLRPIDDGIVMQQLRYKDEVRPIAEVPLGDAKVKTAELKLAMQIVDQGVSEHFRPEQYDDDVRARMLEAIQGKVEGQEITSIAPEESKAQVIDLMEALKASLGKTAQRKPARRAAKTAVRSTRKKTAGRGRK